MLLKFDVTGEAKPTQNYNFFGNLCQFTIIYSANFVQIRYWWIVHHCCFNDMKHIFIQIFIPIDPHVDYIIQLYG